MTSTEQQHDRLTAAVDAYHANLSYARLNSTSMAYLFSEACTALLQLVPKSLAVTGNSGEAFSIDPAVIAAERDRADRFIANKNAYATQQTYYVGFDGFRE